MEIVINNCRYIVKSDKEQLDNPALFKMICELDKPIYLLMLFLINTCEDGLNQIEDNSEQTQTIKHCSRYFAQLPHNDIRI